MLSVEIGTAQVETALRTFQLAPALAQPHRAVRTVLPGILPLHNPACALVGGRPALLFTHLWIHAANSRTAVQLQQSAVMSQAPRRRQTFTYFPVSGVRVPSALWMTREKRPISIAMSPE